MDLKSKQNWLNFLELWSKSGLTKTDFCKSKKIKEITDLETRPVVLGHVQRGGRPTAFSRDLALHFGRMAVDCLLEGKSDKAVALHDGKTIEVDFTQAIQKKELNLIPSTISN